MQKPSNVLNLVELKHTVTNFLSWDLSRLNFIRAPRTFFDRKFKRKLAPLSPEEDITALQTSFSIWESFRRLRRRRWSAFDVQYLGLASLTIFSLWIIEPASPFLKTTAFLGYMLLLLMPATSQFFLPSWPIWAYLLLFFSSRYVGTSERCPRSPVSRSRFVPYDVRPLVSVKVLPALEDILYGADLSNLLSEYTNPVLDVLAWIPYGIGHFALPAACAALLFLFAAPGTAPCFARAFGWMSILGVAAQLLLPCAPPWYERVHGLGTPAAYGMAGSPAGLARIDALLGVDLYTTSFTTAPVPFGAFPSLHAADAALEALFLGRCCFPRLRGLCAFYVAWLCWATMYLNHHYAVDLVGGVAIAAAVFLAVRAGGLLPRQQPDKEHRWEYTFVEAGSARKGAADEESGLGLARRDSDVWSAHSASSASTLCGSPLTPPDESQWTRETVFSKRSS